jgi:L-lactate permease
MDEKERVQFKGMFTVNVIYLNILIFALALAVSLVIIAPNTWGPKIPIVVGSIVVFVIFLILFIWKYRSTKAWLAIHGTTKEERMAEIRAEREAERARIRAELEAELREEIEEEKRREEEEKNA